ncbi:MAG: type II secretion system F family protein [Planctomycetota bacterium]
MLLLRPRRKWLQIIRRDNSWFAEEILPLLGFIGLLILISALLLVWDPMGLERPPPSPWSREKPPLIPVGHLAAAVWDLGIAAIIIYSFFRIWHASIRIATRRQTISAHLLAAVRIGMPLHEALYADQGQPRPVRRQMRILRGSLEQGGTLGQALRGTSTVFPDWYCRLLELGERHGCLAAGLEQAIEHDHLEEERRSRFMADSVYPLFLVFCTLLAALFVLEVLLPKFLMIFTELGIASPKLLQLVWMRYWLVEWALPIVGIGVLAGVLLLLPVDGPAWLHRWKRWLGVLPVLLLTPLLLPLALLTILPMPWGPDLKRLPGLGRLARTLRALRDHLPWHGRRRLLGAYANWASTLGLALHAGERIETAMFAAEQDMAPRARRHARTWRRAVECGTSPAVALARDASVPAWFRWQLRVAEQSGDLASGLRDAGRTLSNRLRDEAARALLLILPLSILPVAWMVWVIGSALFGSWATTMDHLLDGGA